VVGIKPTLGRVSRDGVFGLSWTCDVVGPIARTVEDAALLLAAMVRNRSADLFPTDPVNLRGVRIGVPRGWFVTDNSSDVDDALARLHRVLDGLGVILVPVGIDGIAEAPDAGSRTVIPEGVVSLEQALRPVGGLAANLDHFGADLRAAMTEQVGPRARPLAAAAYASALGRTIPALKRAFADTLAGVDALLTPTTPATAVPIAQDVSMNHNGRSVDTFATFTRHTVGVSVTGLPAISIPAGVDRAGLPVGAQLIGAPWSESRLIGIAAAVQHALGTAR
jgi:aspartyl-tRNA(Asn)/glutamyl-tRNA(Gln) amidotransferase subunit A